MVRHALPSTASRALLKHPARGFTLVEMLAVIGIMVLISALFLTNNNRYGGKVLLENMSYDIALTIRQAQVYGISVERYSGTTFASAYGVHFQTSLANHFVLFADNITPLNGIYNATSCDTPANCELVTDYTLYAGYTISNLCVTLSDGSSSCGHSSLDITFERPNPDAFIRVDGDPTVYSSATITLNSPVGYTKSVTVEESGQIAVQ